jgi:hypothetical protein
MKNTNLKLKSADVTYAVLVRQPITLPVDTATQRAAVAQTVSGQHQGV